MLRLLKSKLGEGNAIAFGRVIALVLMALTIIAVGVIYFYATAQAERGVYNMTRAFRGFR